MHIEFRNIGSGKHYYLCYSGEDVAGIIYTPDIRNHLTDLDQTMSVKDMFDIIRPVVDRLMKLDPGEFHINAFRFEERPVSSLTVIEPTTSYGMWRVGEPVWLNGNWLPTKFIPL